MYVSMFSLVTFFLHSAEYICMKIFFLELDLSVVDRSGCLHPKRAALESSGALCPQSDSFTKSRVTLGKVFKLHFLIEALDKASILHLLKKRQLFDRVSQTGQMKTT